MTLCIAIGRHTDETTAIDQCAGFAFHSELRWRFITAASAAAMLASAIQRGVSETSYGLTSHPLAVDDDDNNDFCESPTAVILLDRLRGGAGASSICCPAR